MVGTRLGPDNGEAEGGVLDALARGLGGCGWEEVTDEGRGDEKLRDDLGPYV